MSRHARSAPAPEVQAKAGEPPARQLPARVATVGLVLVLLALTVFCVVSAVLTSRAAQEVGHRSAISDLYESAERARLMEEAAENEFLFKRGDKQREQFDRRAVASTAALLAVPAAEDGQRQHDELLALHSTYRERARTVFAVAQTDLEWAIRLDEESLVPVSDMLKEKLQHKAAENREMARTALADLTRLQQIVVIATPIVFTLGLVLLGLFTAVLRSHRHQIDSQADENRHQALHDSLTGLPNRALLHARTEQALAATHSTDGPLALMLIDLDRFKEVNDTLGHHYGDVVLQAVANRLQDTLRAGDTVARLGGDEFAILLPEVGDLEAALHVAARARAAIAASIEADGVCLDVDASVGVVVSGEHGTAVETLLQHADIAMYSAKERGLGVCVYDHDLNYHTPERLGLLGELRRAIDNSELVLHFQPKVALPGEEVCGVEALVRWQHPERGLIPPALFIPVAERTALIRPLTRYVLSAALEQCRRWQDEGRALHVAVNVSARNLLDDQFVDDVRELLVHWQVPSSCLELEVTESAIMADPDRAQRILTHLAELGLTLSIDDFGAGYTSLAHLKNLPVHQLKIDRSFVSQMNSDPSDALIVRSVVELGHNLGLTTIAEGVEDQATWDQLAQVGCDVAQGYYLSRPLPADQLEAWFDAARTVAHA